MVTEKDKEFAGMNSVILRTLYQYYKKFNVRFLFAQGHIVRNLESASQEVPKELMDLAMKSSWFKNSR